MRSDLTKPYNLSDNPPDLTSADCANVMAYLKSHGLPDPQIIVQEVGSPVGIRYTNTELVYTDPLRPPLSLSLYLVLNHPSVAVVDYKLWRGEVVQYPEEFKPPKAPDTPPPPPAKPTVLVGALMAGSRYYPVAGDDSPDGTKFADARGAFVKKVVQTPFGNTVYWERIA